MLIAKTKSTVYVAPKSDKPRNQDSTKSKRTKSLFELYRCPIQYVIAILNMMLDPSDAI